MGGQSSKSATEILATPISNLSDAKQNVIYVKTTDSIPATLEVLFKHNLLSAPIYDEKEKKFVCIVDLLDFVTHIITTVMENELIERSTQRVLQEESQYKSIDAANESKRNPWHPVKPASTVKEVIDHFVSCNVHRVAIVEGDQLLRIVSQSDIVSFIHKNIDSWANMKDVPISKMGIGQDKVYTVDESTKALEAFKAMHKQHVSAIAFVNKEGELAGYLSNSDLKLIGAQLQNIWDVYLPLSEYKSKLNRPAPVTVSPDETFGNLLAAFVTNSVHRVYVVENKKPVRIISLTDVIQHVAKSTN